LSLAALAPDECTLHNVNSSAVIGGLLWQVSD